ncbi:hypothetical protein [Acidisphaera sp. L21]|uniref:hypothetical protein n=1 Tax=Acidisphaera sp. L21 TaxID=1641851 RepID=UPI00131AD27C|nr:hypothetical protein [Acidisphaera sp. L21]
MDVAVSNQADLALPDVLQAAAAELMHLASVADGLGVCQSSASSEQWQSLDRMSQHLEGLSTFLSAISSVVPDIRPDLADALAAVRVGALFNRLTATAPAADVDDSGDFDLFDA